MKLLILSDAVSPHTESWVNGLVDAGQEVTLLSFRPVGERHYDSRVKVVTLGLNRAYRIIDQIRFILLANYHSLRFRPDIVNAMYATTYGSMALFIPFRTVITSVWGSDILVRPRRSRKIHWLMRAILARSRAVFATSSVLVDAAKAMTTRTVYRIPFGVDDAYFDVATRKTEDGIIRIGCVKWLSPVYGIDLLIQAFAGLIQRVPSMRFELYLAGDGPEEDELRRLAKKLNIDHLTHFTGRLDAREVRSLHRKLDIAVYPSRSESFGVALLESQASGVPVVASRVGGIPEVVKEGETGFLFEQGDVPALVDRLQQLVENPDLRQRMGRKGMEWVRENFTWKRCVDSYLVACREVLLGVPKPGAATG